MAKQSKLAQTAAVLSVVASLGLVAYEIRQNTQAVLGQTVQAVADQQTALAVMGVENAELRNAWNSAIDDVESLTADERSILGWYYTAVMRHTENRYRQFQLGMLDEGDLEGFGTQGNLFRNPYFARWWPPRADGFPADFARFVETTLLPLGRP